jgi:hypothetical protein
MGILAEPWSFITALVNAGELPRGFSVLELGDQYLTFKEPHQLAAEAFAGLKCGRYLSVDGNGRGDVTFDLNVKASKLKALLAARGEPTEFDLVTDFGTGEHIFDQAAVWRTLHVMTKVRGYMVFDRPTQGYEGHCFHRSDESTFTDIAAANGYKVIRLERASTKRGELVRGVFYKRRGGRFVIPQQGRYHKILGPIL